jgi:hypothetical protein
MFQWLNGRKLQIVASTVACALAIGGGVALSGQAASDTVTFTLQQAKPTLDSTSVNPSHPRDGDDLIYYATLSENGKIVGHVNGLKVVVRNASDPNSTDLASKHDETRMTLMQFSLGGNDSLIAQGVTLDKPDGLVPGYPEVRAVTGGTGKYKFAHGQVTSTRNADGTYTQAFELRM